MQWLKYKNDRQILNHILKGTSPLITKTAMRSLEKMLEKITAYTQDEQTMA